MLHWVILHLPLQSITHLIPSFYEDMGQGQEFVFEDEVSTGSYWEEDEKEWVEEERQKEAEDIQKENESGKVKVEEFWGSFCCFNVLQDESPFISLFSLL